MIGVRCTKELIDLWLNNDLRILYSVFEVGKVSRFIANLGIGRISCNLKKKYVFLSGRNLQVGKFSE